MNQLFELGLDQWPAFVADAMAFGIVVKRLFHVIEDPANVADTAHHHFPCDLNIFL
jgi:hypothetical protein